MNLSYFAVPGIKRSLIDAVSNPAHDADAIYSKIIAYFKVEKKSIEGYSRDRPLPYIRHMCYYMLRKYTSLSLKQIGQMLGGKDHTTVIYGCTAIQDLMFSEKFAKEDVEILMKII